MEMKVICWYRNGSLDSFRQFGIHNQDKPISLRLMHVSEPVNGRLSSYSFSSQEWSGIFLQLTDTVNHPAYYSIEDIESVHAGISAIRSAW